MDMTSTATLQVSVPFREQLQWIQHSSCAIQRAATVDTAQLLPMWMVQLFNKLLDQIIKMKFDQNRTGFVIYHGMDLRSLWPNKVIQ